MTQYEAAEVERRSASAVLNRVAAFDGSPEQFLGELIAAQCELTGAQAGAFLRRDREGRIRVTASHPAIDHRQSPPAWLAQAAEIAGQYEELDEPVVRPVHKSEELYGQGVSEHLILLPIYNETSVRGVAAFRVRTRNKQQVEQCERELELSLSLLALYETRLTVQKQQLNLRSLSTALEVLTATNDQRRFKAASMALCNELASRWSAERVSFGLLRGRYVKLQAMSQTEHINRKMKLVQDLESSMEECLDQDTEVLHPSPPEATYIHRVTTDFAQAHGPVALCSLPLRLHGEVVGVVTLERTPDHPFTIDELEFLRLTCDLCTPRLLERFDQDRWFGARLATQTCGRLGGCGRPAPYVGEGDGCWRVGGGAVSHIRTR